MAQAYPAELVVHLLPCVHVSGLEAGASATTFASLEHPAHAHPALCEALRQALLAQARPKLWRPRGGDTPLLRAVMVDYAHAIPPARTRAGARVADAEEHAALARLPPRSPLSPLFPGGPLYPDGMVSPLWVRKHTVYVPAVHVAFFCLPESAPTSLARDAALIDAIAGVRAALAPRGIKVVVALLVDARARAGMEARLQHIRRSAGLEARHALHALDVTNKAGMLPFLHQVLGTVQQHAVEYYKERARHVRRNRARYPPPPSIVQPIASAAAHARLPSAGQPWLSAAGWQVRTSYKLGVFAELRDDLPEALHMYLDAYDVLVTQCLADPAALPPRTKRWAEAKVLADTLSFRVIKWHLYAAAYADARAQFARHLARMQALSTSWDMGPSTPEYWTWLAKQYQLLATLAHETQWAPDRAFLDEGVLRYHAALCLQRRLELLGDAGAAEADRHALAAAWGAAYDAAHPPQGRWAHLVATRVALTYAAPAPAQALAYLERCLRWYRRQTWDDLRVLVALYALPCAIAARDRTATLHLALELAAPVPRAWAARRDDAWRQVPEDAAWWQDDDAAPGVAAGAAAETASGDVAGAAAPATADTTADTAATTTADAADTTAATTADAANTAAATTSHAANAPSPRPAHILEPGAARGLIWVDAVFARGDAEAPASMAFQVRLSTAGARLPPWPLRSVRLCVSGHTAPLVHVACTATNATAHVDLGEVTAPTHHADGAWDWHAPSPWLWHGRLACATPGTVAWTHAVLTLRTPLGDVDLTQDVGRAAPPVWWMEPSRVALPLPPRPDTRALAVHAAPFHVDAPRDMYAGETSRLALERTRPSSALRVDLAADAVQAGAALVVDGAPHAQYTLRASATPPPLWLRAPQANGTLVVRVQELADDAPELSADAAPLSAPRHVSVRVQPLVALAADVAWTSASQGWLTTDVRFVGADAVDVHGVHVAVPPGAGVAADATLGAPAPDDVLRCVGDDAWLGKTPLRGALADPGAAPAAAALVVRWRRAAAAADVPLSETRLRLPSLAPPSAPRVRVSVSGPPVLALGDEARLDVTVHNTDPQHVADVVVEIEARDTTLAHGQRRTALPMMLPNETRYVSLHVRPQRLGESRWPVVRAFETRGAEQIALPLDGPHHTLQVVASM